MVAIKEIQYSPSLVDTFETCQAQFWHQKHDDGTGRLPTDGTAAKVSIALHDAFMEYHRRIVQRYSGQSAPDTSLNEVLLRGLVSASLRKQRLNPSVPLVADRLARVDKGISAVAELVPTDMPRWAKDPDTEELLAWAEAYLNHGMSIPAVELSQGFLSRTRPDIIGIRLITSDKLRVVVRDYKAKNQSVDSRFDNGILLRAFWAYSELQNPRCEWFIKNRRLNVEADIVDLETVNLMYAGEPEFLSSSSVSGEELIAEKERFIGLLSEMSDIDMQTQVAEIPASPNGLCKNWCPFLHRCVMGKQNVQQRYGKEALEERLSQLN